MITKFGIYCRKLRLDTNEILYDMAKKLGVSSAFLSAVETGKKSIPKIWYESISSIYNLDEKQKKELYEAILNSSKEIKFNIEKEDNSNKDLIIKFARSLQEFDEEDKAKMLAFLDRRER